MNKLFAWIIAIVAPLLVAACGGGSPPGMPANVTVVPHDSSATVTWTMDSGIEYWVWSGAGTVTQQTCTTFLNCVINRGVSSPFLVTGLTNGTSYSVFVNGAHDGSPVGQSSPSLGFVPIPAGSTWTLGPPLGQGNLLGIGYTPLTTTTATTFVTVGSGGTIFSSPDSSTWTARTSNVAVNLNAVAFALATFAVVGDSGVILTSTDGVTWTARTSGTSNNLHGLTTNGSLMLAVGGGGTILVSSDGTTWTQQTSNTTRDLYGVTFGTNLFVAVGAGGTLLTSAGGANWTPVASGTTSDLKSVAFGNGVYVAVGASGALVTSADGVTWTARPPISANNFNAVVFGSQFVAVGNGGAIYVSADGVTWQAAKSGTTNDLYALVYSASVAANTLAVGYTAVGAAGVNLTSY